MNPVHYHTVQTILICFAVVYFLLEIVLNLNDVDNDTSNIVLLNWSKGKLLFIPFALGAIGGHLFLGTENADFKMNNSLHAVLILFAASLAQVLIAIKWKFRRTKLLLTTLLVLGVLYGHFFWSMNYKVPPGLPICGQEQFLQGGHYVTKVSFPIGHRIIL